MTVKKASGACHNPGEQIPIKELQELKRRCIPSRMF